MRTVPAALLVVGVSAAGPTFAQQPQQLPGITVTTPPKAATAPNPAVAAPSPQASTPATAPDVSAVQSLDPSANDVGKAQSGSQGVGLARADRGAADLSHGRGARGGAGPGRHPAQRGGEGEPVFPARVQSGSRHGSGHHRGRHARQHAHARPRPGLRRHQLPDPRVGAGPLLPQGSLLRLRRRLRLGRRDLSRRGRPAGQELRPGRARQLRPSARRHGHVGAGRPRRHAARGRRDRALRRTLGPPGRVCASSTACCAIRRAATSTASP